MPHQYKHKEWERYLPMIPLVTWIKSQKFRKLKSWTATGIAWTFLLGGTTIYLTDWNPIAKFLPSKQKTETNTNNIDPSDNSLYQKVAYGCGFYKFIKPRCKVRVDDYERKKENETKDVSNATIQNEDITKDEDNNLTSKPAGLSTVLNDDKSTDKLEKIF